MTRKEISTISERTAAKLARGEISARPLSNEQKRRAQEIIRREREKRENEALRA